MHHDPCHVGRGIARGRHASATFASTSSPDWLSNKYKKAKHQMITAMHMAHEKRGPPRPCCRIERLRRLICSHRSLCCSTERQRSATTECHSRHGARFCVLLPTKWPHSRASKPRPKFVAPILAPVLKASERSLQHYRATNPSRWLLHPSEAGEGSRRSC